MRPPPAAGSLTEGNIVRPLLRLALPFALSNLLGLLTLVVDRLWVGRVGTEAMAALGTANAALMILMTSAMGMAVGTLAGVARAIGGGDVERAGRFFRQGMLLGWAVGLLFCLGAIALPGPIIEFVRPGTQPGGPAEAYLRISMAGLLFYTPLLSLIFGLQGAGEARAAMRLAAIAPVLNAVLDPLFIFGFDLGLPGAAWATVIATAVAFGMALRTTGTRSRLQLKRVGPPWQPDGTILKQIAAVGFPGTLEHVVRTVAGFALVKLLAGFGDEVLSAYTTAMMLLAMLIFPGLALGQATASLVGQNLGAHRPDRAWRTAWTATGLYVAFMAVLGGVLFVVAGPLIGAFDPNPKVVAEGVRLLHTVVLCFPLLAVAFILSRAFAGSGNTLPAMLVAAVAHLAFQLPVVHALGEAWGPAGAYWGMAAAFMVQGLLAAAVFALKLHPSRFQPANKLPLKTAT